MKLIVQIPCHNEAEALEATLAAIPRQIDGIDAVEIVVVDDGSTDETVAIARREGVEHIVCFARQRGLARAFKAGLTESLRQGADIIVNTDADNQYCASDIGKLIGPILAHETEIVIGARPIDRIEHFSWIKKRLQKIGSWVVRIVSGTDAADAGQVHYAVERDQVLEESLELAREIARSEEHTPELQSQAYLVCRLPLEKKKNTPAHFLVL